MRTIYFLLFFTISIPLLLSCGTDANEDMLGSIYKTNVNSKVRNPILLACFRPEKNKRNVSFRYIKQYL
jgi:hypothetical protein